MSHLYSSPAVVPSCAPPWRALDADSYVAVVLCRDYMGGMIAHCHLGDMAMQRTALSTRLLAAERDLFREKLRM